MVHICEFFENLKLAVKQCYPIGQFLKDENWWKMPKLKKLKCDILGDFQTLCLSSCSSVKFETKTCIFSLSSISASSFDFFVLSVDDPSALVFDELVSGIDNNSLAKISLFSSTLGFSSEKARKNS